MMIIDETRQCKCPHCNSDSKNWLTQETVDTLLFMDFYECKDCKTIYAKAFRATQPNGIHYQEILIKRVSTR